MEDRIFLNKQVSEIVGITQRQVLSWTEKGLIVPFKESTGVGTKRGYNYINLLEFGLCKRLFSLGFGFRAVKKMFNDIRNSGTIKDWANDFEKYYSEQFEYQTNRLNQIIKEAKPKDNKIAEFIKKHPLLTLYRPSEPVGILAYFFCEGKDRSLVIPWDMDYVINLNIIKEAFVDSDCGILVDVGVIKKRIDSKM